MHAKILRPLTLLACCLTVAACDSEDDVELRIAMETPRPDDLVAPDSNHPAEEVRLEVSTIMLEHVDEGWIEVEPDRENGEVYFGETPLTLAYATLPPGEYTQLRLVVGDAKIYIDGYEYPLDIPSGESSGFKIHGDFCIPDHDPDDDRTDENDDGEPEQELYLRWDLDEGLRHSDQRGYWLVPSVHIEGAPGC